MVQGENKEFGKEIESDMFTSLQMEVGTMWKVKGSKIQKVWYY